jgi:hypothetical protein
MGEKVQRYVCFAGKRRKVVYVTSTDGLISELWTACVIKNVAGVNVLSIMH